MLAPYQDTLLDNFIFTSSCLVVLQTLRAGYLLELDCSNRQEIKNFRSGVLLDQMRAMLEDLEPMIDYLVGVLEGNPLPEDQRQNIGLLLNDLEAMFDWAKQEILLKEKRLSLMEMEDQWNKTKYNQDFWST